MMSKTNHFSPIEITNSHLRDVCDTFYSVEYFIPFDKVSKEAYVLLYKNSSTSDLGALYEHISLYAKVKNLGITVHVFNPKEYVSMFIRHKDKFIFMDDLLRCKTSLSFTKDNFEHVFTNFFHANKITENSLYLQVFSKKGLLSLTKQSIFAFRLKHSCFDSLKEYEHYVSLLEHRSYYIFSWKTLEVVDYEKGLDFHYEPLSFSIFKRYFIRFSWRPVDFFGYHFLPCEFSRSYIQQKKLQNYIAKVKKKESDTNFVKNNGVLFPNASFSYYKRAIPFDISTISGSNLEAYNLSHPLERFGDTYKNEFYLYNAFCRNN